MDENTAIQNSKRFKRIDPFPKIPASLLNSADIKSYVDHTGLIYPFHENDLKSASYAARISGKCKYWDDKENKFKEIELNTKGDKLILSPNSIAFVGIEPTFRLPDYIALRFNLTITHVYKGLLLGTGPLIDPGFEGKISIPLHNLTSNYYVFSYDETLIWIEFTKTSPIPNVEKLQDSEIESYEMQRCKEFRQFPLEKTHKNLDYYIARALDGTRYEAIISSIPEAVREAKENADKASESLGSIKRWAIGGAIAGVLAVVAAMGTIIYGSWSIQRDYYREATSKIELLNNKFNEYIVSTDKELQKINNMMADLSKSTDKIIESSLNDDSEASPSETTSVRQNSHQDTKDKNDQSTEN